MYKYTFSKLNVQVGNSGINADLFLGKNPQKRTVQNYANKYITNNIKKFLLQN